MPSTSPSPTRSPVTAATPHRLADGRVHRSAVGGGDRSDRREDRRAQVDPGRSRPAVDRPFKRGPPTPGPPRRVRSRRPTTSRRDLWRWPRIAVAVLGAVLFFQGVSSLTSGSWIAENIGEPFSPHAMTEGGFALIAVGSLRWSPASTVSGWSWAWPPRCHWGSCSASTVSAKSTCGRGAALHLTEGVLAVVLLVTFVTPGGGPVLRP